MEEGGVGEAKTNPGGLCDPKMSLRYTESDRDALKPGKKGKLDKTAASDKDKKKKKSEMG